MIYAQDAMYWDTKTSLAKTIGEITELLDDYGADQSGTSKKSDNGKVIGLTVFFILDGTAYMTTFTPLPIKPNSRTQRSASEMQEAAVRQMGRVAWYWLKTVLMMHQYGHTEVLIPYAQVRASNGQSTTLQEQGMERFLNAATGGLLALPAPEVK